MTDAPHTVLAKLGELRRTRADRHAFAVPLLVFGALDPVPDKGFTVLSMIAVLVIALAWLERSVLLGAVAGLFALAAVQAEHAMWPWNMGGVLRSVGWPAEEGPQAIFQLLLPPGLILLAGGVAGTLVARRMSRDD
jgi:hypothetical protein